MTLVLTVPNGTPNALAFLEQDGDSNTALKALVTEVGPLPSCTGVAAFTTAAINAALATGADEVCFPPGVYEVTGLISQTRAGQVLNFYAGAVLRFAASGAGQLRIAGAAAQITGFPVARWDAASAVDYIAIMLSGAASQCCDIRMEVNANVANCTLLRLGDLAMVGAVTFAGTGGSFKYGTDLCRQDGTAALYARAGLQLWQMTDDGVTTRNFTALLRYRSTRSQAGPISISNGGRHFFNSIVEVDGQHNSLMDPQINSSAGSNFGILGKDDAEFFEIWGGEIVGNYRASSVGVAMGDGSKLVGTPAVGQWKLYGTKIRNWALGWRITGSADAPLFDGCFIGNNSVAEGMIESQRGADIWPVSALSFKGCYRESAAFPGAGVPFLLLRTGSLRGGLMAGCETGADNGVSVLAEATFSTNNMQFEGCRFAAALPTDAVTEPNTSSEFYFGINDFQGSNLISRGAFADRATSFKDAVMTTLRTASLKVGAAANPAMTQRLASFATANFAAGIPANDQVSLVLPFAGCVTTDYLNWCLTGTLPTDTGLDFFAFISSAGNVTLRARNHTAVAVGAISGTIMLQAFRGF